MAKLLDRMQVLTREVKSFVLVTLLATRGHAPQKIDRLPESNQLRSLLLEDMDRYA